MLDPQDLLSGYHVEYINKCLLAIVSPCHPLPVPPEFCMVDPSSNNKASFRLNPVLPNKGRAERECKLLVS